MDVKTRLVNYYKNNAFIQKYIKGLDSSTNEIVLSYNGLTKNISIDELENITDETSIISYLNPNMDLREERLEEQPISMVEPKVISSEVAQESLNDIKILTEIKSKAGLDNLLKKFAINESTGLIDINKAISIVEKNTIDEVVKSIKDHYEFDLDLQNYDITGKFIGSITPSGNNDDEKIMSSFNNVKVYLEAANMYMDQINFTDEDINNKMKEYIEKVRSILYPVKEQPKTMSVTKEVTPVVNQNAGFADIFVLCLIIIVYVIIIVNLILKLV